MKTEDIRAFESCLERQIPGFGIVPKEDSKLMKVFGVLLSPLNPVFDQYTTVWGDKAYLPKALRDGDLEYVFMVLAHEFVHLWDKKRKGFWGFDFPYVSPQIYALIPIVIFALFGSWVSLLTLSVGYLVGALVSRKRLGVFWAIFAPSVVSSLVLGWFLSGFWTLLLPLVMALLFLPSPGRTRLELRGYTMSIGVSYLRLGRIDSAFVDEIQTFFTGPDYLFMCRDKAKIRERLQVAVAGVVDGSVWSQEPYKVVYEFMLERGLVSKKYT